MHAKHTPSLCSYTGARYSWRADDPGRLQSIPVLGFRPLRGLSPSQLDVFLAPLRSLMPTTNASHNFVFAGYRALLGQYTYQQLARYPAILYVPYQVSVMSFYEQYSMGIPILAPSARLLTEWHMQYRMVSELTWSLVFGTASRKGVIPRHPSVPEAEEPFDPNDEDSEAAVRHWLGFADFYVYPHIVLFDSWADLAEKLREECGAPAPRRRLLPLHSLTLPRAPFFAERVDFAAVSQRMLQHSEVLSRELSSTWAAVIERARAARASERPRLSGSFEDRM